LRDREIRKGFASRHTREAVVRVGSTAGLELD